MTNTKKEMNWKGVVSAFVFLTAVSAVRMGDKPLFVKGKDRETFGKADRGC